MLVWPLTSNRLKEINLKNNQRQMKKHYLFKNLYPLLLLIFITSCNGQVKRNLPIDNVSEPKKIPARQPEINTVYDPFLKKWDAISTNGPKSITRNVLQDKNGNYWFATWEGIIFYDGTHFTNVTLKEGLRPFHVFSVLEDKTGNLWFGTIRGGLYRYDGRSFTLFTTTDGLANDVILCMLEDQAGNIWFGTEEGVSRYNGKTFTNFTTQDGLSGNVNSIAQDKTGKLWFGTRYGVNGDLSCYDGKSFTHFKNNRGLPFSNVRSIIEDKTGNIWIGGQDGLLRYDGKSFTNISTNFIGYIFEDKTGNLWLSEDETNGWVLNKYDGKSSTKIAASSMIFGITEDITGNIWFGTMNGVGRYDGKSVTNFTD
jgi:ligand-binding sensor domain-containing protein